MPEIKLRNQIIPYVIRYSNRARYVHFRMKPETGFEVVIPAGVHIPDLDGLLRERQDWILEHHQKLESLRAQLENEKIRFRSGDIIPYLGEKYELSILEGDYQEVFVVDDEKLIEVLILPVEGIPEVEDIMMDWFRETSKSYILPRVQMYAEMHGFTYKKASIRGQKTRWGSCSSKGNLNFNWRLMMTPPDVIDYIIIHELCHLRELNHSRRFWRMVGFYCPTYQAAEKWLKQFKPPF